MKTNKPLIVVGAILFAVFLLGSGCVDIDWMIVTYKFDMGNGRDGIWEFCPWFKLGWWDGYMFTLARIIAGSGLLFSCLTYVYLRLKDKELGR